MYRSSHALFLSFLYPSDRHSSETTRPWMATSSSPGMETVFLISRVFGRQLRHGEPNQPYLEIKARQVSSPKMVSVRHEILRGRLFLFFLNTVHHPPSQRLQRPHQRR